jgi:hypothetical protein
MKKNNIKDLIHTFNTGVVLTVLGYVIFYAVSCAAGNMSEYNALIADLLSGTRLGLQAAAYGMLYVAFEHLLFQPLLDTFSEIPTREESKSINVPGTIIRIVLTFAIAFGVDRCNVINNEALTNIIVLEMLGIIIIYEFVVQAVMVNHKLRKQSK